LIERQPGQPIKLAGSSNDRTINDRTINDRTINDRTIN